MIVPFVEQLRNDLAILDANGKCGTDEYVDKLKQIAIEEIRLDDLKKED